MAIYKQSMLKDFVKKCDELGGIGAPECRKFIKGFEYQAEVKIDFDIDPFSDRYFRQQCALYTEISGREIDQEKFEMTPIPVEHLLDKANPYGSNDASFISKHCRAVLTSIMVANPPAGAKVLDLGAGWGLSSEMIAYTGAHVTAVDINPSFVQLIQKRAERTGLSIVAVESNFDTFYSEQKFDIIFFYECLHHALRPWETLKKISQFLESDGKIVFAGEPINSLWWPNWGMRLDAESIYVMHKFGWFESGWSASFILECFRRAGLDPVLIGGAGLDGGDICVASRQGAIGLRAITPPPPTPLQALPGVRQLFRLASLFSRK